MIYWKAMALYFFDAAWIPTNLLRTLKFAQSGFWLIYFSSLWRGHGVFIWKQEDIYVSIIYYIVTTIEEINYLDKCEKRRCV